MSRRILIALLVPLAVAVVVAGALVATAVTGDDDLPGTLEGDLPSMLEGDGRAAAQRFFAEYVEPDGRVVRRDQGGDTVSEGQAYAMLLAVALEDPARFERVWSWTQRELQRPDGLLSFLWRDGAVVDPQAATDADLDAAHALLLAADRFERPDLGDEATRIGAAVLARETVAAGGDPLLVAGPWARTAPYAVNPSYIAPPAYTALGAATGDRSWERLAAAGRRLVADVTAPTTGLPPDWARASQDGRVEPAPAPGEPGPPRYSLDAARTFVRMARDCDSDGRALAAAADPFLRRAAQGGIALAYSLDGRRLVEDQHPLGYVAAAAAAQAADDPARAGELLDRAQRLQERFPTYYGGAWVALGHAMLKTSALGGCPTG